MRRPCITQRFSSFKKNIYFGLRPNMDKLDIALVAKNHPLLYLLLPVFFLSLILFNHAYRISHSSDKFLERQTIPAEHPGGFDYRYVYRQSTALKNSINDYLQVRYIYPPLTAVINLPLSLLKEDLAYKTFTYILAALFFLSIYVALKENLSHMLSTEKNTILFLAIIIFSMAYNTYPVMFAIERGNCDIIAALFSIVSLYAVTRNKMVLSIVFLTIAINYKLYPLILFAIILSRFGWKTIPLIIFSNMLALLALGYPGLRYFVHQLFFLHPFSMTIWEGNHSLYSFFNQLTAIINPIYLTPAFYFILCMLISIFTLIWILHVTRGKTEEGSLQNPLSTFSDTEIGLIGMAFQLMALLPPVSHDYKLVILIVPYILLISRNTRQFQINPWWMLTIGMFLSISMGFIFAIRYSIVGVNSVSYPFLVPLKTLAILCNYLLFAIIAIISLMKRSGTEGNQIISPQ